MGLDIETKKNYMEQLKLIEQAKPFVQKLFTANAAFRDAQDELEQILLDQDGDCKIPYVGFYIGEFDDTKMEGLYDDVERFSADLQRMKNFYTMALDNEQAHDEACLYLKLRCVTFPVIICDESIESFYKMCCDISKESKQDFLTQMRVLLKNN